MLSTIQISNFRGFENLELKDLGRINLIVGRNNTGKTSLLEAITFISQPNQIYDLPSLFRAYPKDNVHERIFRWFMRDNQPDKAPHIKAIDTKNGHLELIAFLDSMRHSLKLEHNLRGQTSGHGIEVRYGHVHSSIHVCNISVLHRNPADLVKDFAEAVRPVEGEHQMEELLRSVDSRIRSVRLDYDRNNNAQIVVDIGLSERIPIQQIGQGVYRLVAIFSEMLGRKPVICFIDEIENGLHHTILPQVWKGIAEAATRLNIQVFATTHSHECLVAAHEAFMQRKPYDFRVIQLYNLNNRIEGRTLGQEHIQAAIKGDIDLR